MLNKKFESILLVAILVISNVFSSPVGAFKGSDVKEDYTGEEFFLAIVMGQGELAEQKYKDLWTDEQFDINNSDEAIELGQEIVSEIKKVEPEFFSDLQTAVYSKDYIETTDIIREGESLFIQALEEIGDKVEVAEVGDIEPASSLAVVAVVYAAVLVTVAAGITHAGAVTFYLTAAAVGPGIKSNDSSSFEEEEVVKELVDAVVN